MAKNERPYTEPCSHGDPLNPASKLHAICIFCYRDRLIAACGLLEETIEAKKRQAQTVWNNAIHIAIDEALAIYDEKKQKIEKEAKGLIFYENTTEECANVASCIAGHIQKLLYREKKNDQET